MKKINWIGPFTLKAFILVVISLGAASLSVADPVDEAIANAVQKPNMTNLYSLMNYFVLREKGLARYRIIQKISNSSIRREELIKYILMTDDSEDEMLHFKFLDFLDNLDEDYQVVDMLIRIRENEETAEIKEKAINFLRELNPTLALKRTQNPIIQREIRTPEVFPVGSLRSVVGKAPLKPNESADYLQLLEIQAATEHNISLSEFQKWHPYNKNEALNKILRDDFASGDTRRVVRAIRASPEHYKRNYKYMFGEEDVDTSSWVLVEVFEQFAVSNVEIHSAALTAFKEWSSFMLPYYFISEYARCSSVSEKWTLEDHSALRGLAMQFVENLGSDVGSTQTIVANLFIKDAQRWGWRNPEIGRIIKRMDQTAVVRANQVFEEFYAKSVDLIRYHATQIIDFDDPAVLEFGIKYGETSILEKFTRMGDRRATLELIKYNIRYGVPNLSANTKAALQSSPFEFAKEAVRIYGNSVIKKLKLRFLVWRAEYAKCNCLLNGKQPPALPNP